MDMTLVGTGPTSNVEMQVDPSHNAARLSIRPVEHQTPNGSQGGHFALTAVSGSIAASLAGASELFSVRWTDTNKIFMLLQLKAAVGVYTAAQTVANPLELDVVKARGFTVDYTTNATNIQPASGSQRMRTNTMADTLFGSSNKGVNICTTTGMTGSTKVLDTAAFGNAMFPGNGLGVADTKELYKWEPTFHPFILSNNEGLVIRNIAAFGAAATYKLLVTMIFAELQAF